MYLMERMVLVAGQHGYLIPFSKEDWTARPIQVLMLSHYQGLLTVRQIRALQSNTFDCGVWVITYIASVLRGHLVNNLREDDMPHLRRQIHLLIQQLPLQRQLGS
jgi:hypothetical protein